MKINHSVINGNEQVFASLWGNLNNLRVNVSQTGLTVKGSLARFHYSNNLERLTRQSTQDAIAHLSDVLHLPMKDAKVYRLDAGSNLIMQRPVGEYLSMLGDTQHFKRSTVSNLGGASLYFTNSRRCLTFYDKVAEMQKHKNLIPNIFHGKNVLRYESRLTQRLASQLKLKSVQAFQLYNEQFYMMVLDAWKKAYFSIPKIKKLKMSDSVEVTNVKDLMNQLALIGLNQLGGEQKILEMFKHAKQAGTIDKEKHKRLRDKVEELVSTPEAFEPNECIEELDRKIEQSVRHYR